MAVETGTPEITTPEQQEEYEPILPIETKLIVTSLVLAVVLMGLLVWLSTAFFSS